MQLIVLTGLVSIEKIKLTVDLATHWIERGKTVRVIDNIARLPIDSEISPVAPERYTGDVLPQLDNILAAQPADVSILAVSEQAHPEQLFIALDALPYDVTTLALIDLRTCDCFPNVRGQLELYADQVVMMPYDRQEVLTHVRHVL